uniref:Uncharacterized protein n=1 Tax=Catharus ustulatus TaxID=91951 RepID=A0A8C3UI72_CATUS
VMFEDFLPRTSVTVYFCIHSVYINFSVFVLFICFISSCLMGFITVVYQVLSLISRLSPARGLGLPQPSFQTTFIITPLGQACYHHLRSLAGRFVHLILETLMFSLWL